MARSSYGNLVLSPVSNRLVGPHVLVWEEFMNTEVPFGDDGTRCVIHHLDQNRQNNDILNLVCMDRLEHLRWHGRNRLISNGSISNEMRKNLSEGQKKVKHKPRTDKERVAISNGMKGHKTSEETREKIRKALTGKKMSDEARKKMSEAAKNRKRTDKEKLWIIN